MGIVLFCIILFSKTILEFKMNYGRFVLLKRIPLECRAYRYDKWRNDNIVDKSIVK